MFNKLLFFASFLALLIGYQINASATQIDVEVQMDGFHPHSFDVYPGDTINWNWIAGEHTTTSTSIPQGASPWNVPIDSGNVAFHYVVTEEGIYNFVCTPHESSGSLFEVGSFTAHPVSGINDLNNQQLKVYPNPFTSELFIESNAGIAANTPVIVSDILGKQVSNAGIQVTNGKIRIETSDLVPGIYLVTLGNGEGMKEKTVRVVKR